MGIYGTPELGTSNNYDPDFYKCKKCGNEYFKTWNHCPKCGTQQGKGQIRPIFLILLIVVVLFATYIKFGIPDFKNGKFISNINQTEEITEIEFSAEPVANPPTGIYQLFTENEQIAPFAIKKHDDSLNYLIKFKNVDNDTTTFTIFLNKDENCDLKIPLGNYEIITASGETWYGDQALFGPNTNYIKYDNIFQFYKTETGYQGWYIELTKSAEGTLRSEKISKDEF